MTGERARDEQDFHRRPVSRPGSGGAPVGPQLFETVKDPDTETYPDPAETPLVYPAKRILAPSFPKQSGAQQLDDYTLSEEITWLFGSLDGAGFVFAVEGSVVLAEPLDGHWYIRGLIQRPADA